MLCLTAPRTRRTPLRRWWERAVPPPRACCAWRAASSWLSAALRRRARCCAPTPSRAPRALVPARSSSSPSCSRRCRPASHPHWTKLHTRGAGRPRWWPRRLQPPRASWQHLVPRSHQAFPCSRRASSPLPIRRSRPPSRARTRAPRRMPRRRCAWRPPTLRWGRSLTRPVACCRPTCRQCSGSCSIPLCRRPLAWRALEQASHRPLRAPRRRSQRCPYACLRACWLTHSLGPARLPTDRERPLPRLALPRALSSRCRSATWASTQRMSSARCARSACARPRASSEGLSVPLRPLRLHVPRPWHSCYARARTCSGRSSTAQCARLPKRAAPSPFAPPLERLRTTTRRPTR
mmetsp:Transcript_10802/g.44727  ORF Transcript_10802/g.44727 Transcript_10802/m.44727 type:complete len:350 (+) Transcript_10802:3702-4751(+)